jgi:hypothetical protein
MNQILYLYAFSTRQKQQRVTSVSFLSHQIPSALKNFSRETSGRHHTMHPRVKAGGEYKNGAQSSLSSRQAE